MWKIIIQLHLDEIFYIFTDYHYEYGPSHSDDLDYIFDFVGDKCELFEPVDFEIAETMTTFWSNFAKTGNPNGYNVSTAEFQQSNTNSNSSSFSECGQLGTIQGKFIFLS